MTSFKRDPYRTAKTLKMAAAFGLLCLAACGRHAPSARPVVAEAGVSRLSAFEAPACGARVFVAMGVNQKYPTEEDMRVPLGDLFLNGDFVDTVSKFPEITVLDVPAGKTQLSWVPSRYDRIARSNTKQNSLTLNLTDHETTFVVLDWYDDTPQVSGFFATQPANAIRTEVAPARSDTFASKRIVFHRRLDTPCSPTMPQTAAATTQQPPQIALQSPPSLPVVTPPPAPPQPLPQRVMPPPAAKPQQAPMPPAPPPVAVVPSKPEQTAPQVPKPPQVAPPPPPPPARQQAAVASPKPPEIAPPPKPPEAAPPSPPSPQQTELSIPPAQQAAVPSSESGPGDMAVLQAFVPPVQYYYTVNAREGAPAFATPRAEGTPLYTFKDTTELNVVTADADKKWLKVTLPDGRTGFVSAALVATGARLQQ